MVRAGRSLGRILQPGDIVGLSGSLGVGKTVFARGVLRGAGYDGEVPSPSFAIVQLYEPPDCRLPVAHADFYRIERTEEITELGLEELLSDGALVAEWPDRLPALSLVNALRISIARDGPDSRILTWVAPAAWEARWQPR